MSSPMAMSTAQHEPTPPRRVGRLRRFVARTIDWLLVSSIVSYFYADRASDVVRGSAVTTGRTAAGTAIESHRLDWSAIGSMVKGSGVDAGQQLLAEFVLAVLVTAVVYDLIGTLAVRSTVGKALMLARVAWRPDISGPRRVATAFARSLLAVLPGGVAFATWMLWLAGMPFTATAALVGGGVFLLIDGLVHLGTARSLHDRMTRTTVVSWRVRDMAPPAPTLAA